MVRLLPGECELDACASGAPSNETVVTSTAIAGEARRKPIIVNLHLFRQAMCSMCLPLSKEVDRDASAIQRDDQVVLIVGHD
jgi:hypothetical protein